MGLQIHQFPCLSDNYGYLVMDEDTRRVATIDTPDADAILAEMDKLGCGLDMILNTHWHPDHAGGNEKLKAATGAYIVGPAEVRRIAPLDEAVSGGELVALGGTVFEVMDTKGHTAGHISYYDPADSVVFVGDTLFALGCGRLFEGTPEVMWESLTRLTELPDYTRVFCAHEYTASNARFALSVDDDEGLAYQAQKIFEARERGEPTVPTTIGREKAYNPFLRAPLLAGKLGVAADAPAHEAFAAVRAAKDVFKG